MREDKINFIEQIKKGNIEIINKDILTIPNYPFGFKGVCDMTFKKVRNRNGQIVERTSLFNGKVSKPKKTTASRLNIFVYDKELKKHFIIKVNHVTFQIYTTGFMCANLTYKEYYFNYGNKEHQILMDFFKGLINITDEVYNKVKALNGC